MTAQTELFTAAVVHKQKALDALQRFALPEAKTELEVARDIDPYLADVSTLLQAVEFLLTLGIQTNTRSPGLARAWNRIRDARATLPRAVHSVLESSICERVRQLLPADYADFVDPREETLHVGYCYLLLNRLDEAHQKLLDFLTSHPQESYPQAVGLLRRCCLPTESL